jgi:hypothetical protein
MAAILFIRPGWPSAASIPPGYRADQDVSWVIPRVEALAAWLGEHEHDHAGPTALQVELEREHDSRPGAPGA